MIPWSLQTPRPQVEPPEYLPARMLNEYVYCPRLFFYEWVEGLFRDNADTVEGRWQHRRVDTEAGQLPPPEELPPELVKTRSITLASDRLRLIARIDLIEAEGGRVYPVDYKHGAPAKTDSGIEAWWPDQVQLCAQALVLRDNGYTVEEGFIWYAKSRQRVRVRFSQELLDRTVRAAEQALALARGGKIPPPLLDSPKCPGCSLVGICLPDETSALMSLLEPAVDPQLSLFGEPPEPAPESRPRPGQIRRLVASRDDAKPLYLNTQGLYVGKSSNVLRIRDRDGAEQEIRILDICQVNLFGNVQISTQAVHTLCEAGIPICYFSQGGWFYGITSGMNTKNVFLRRAQFRMADEPRFALSLAQTLVAGKIRNQRTMLQRNHIEPPGLVLAQLKDLAECAEKARDLDELLGIEGQAARLYFANFAGMIKVNELGVDGERLFQFNQRNRRPPRDPINALLSLGYSLLTKDLTITCYAVGFDPFIGFYHQPRFGRPALALDLMEPFRPLIVDSAVLSAVNMKMVTGEHFVSAGGAVALTPEGRKNFFRAYELRMDSLVTHPLFDYRVSYRRLLEIQARLLARLLDGEIPRYPVFTTR